MDSLLRALPGYDPFSQAGECWFDEPLAREKLLFIERCCTHVKGELAGQPMVLERWQQAIIANLFGWRRPDGTRRYREALVFIPRKNGKTILAAAIVNLVLFTDAEPGAELYSSAAEREQARLCFENVVGMIRQKPLLSDNAQLFKYSVVVGGSSYKAISADANTKHGFNAHLVVNDELHAHRTPELTEVLMTSTGARRQPLVVHLTTSDYEREGSACNDKHDYAIKVRDNVIDDASFLPVIYEASRDDDWHLPATWAKANPNLGVSIKTDYLVHECQRARDDPAYENTFKRLHLNVRTESSERWVTTDAWDRCKDESLRIEDFAGQQCWCGLDLAATEDLNAFAVAFRDGEGVAIFPYFWVPEDTATRREQQRRIPYSVWGRDGLLNLTPGRTAEYPAIVNDIDRLVERHRLRVEEIAVDRLFQGHAVLTELENRGFLAFAHGQGMIGMAIPTKETKRHILGGTLRHSGHPVLRWMISNAMCETDAAGNEKPSRKSSSEKIDGVVAMIMAVGRAAMRDSGSIYETEGLMAI